MPRRSHKDFIHKFTSLAHVPCTHRVTVASRQHLNNSNNNQFNKFVFMRLRDVAWGNLLLRLFAAVSLFALGVCLRSDWRDYEPGCYLNRTLIVNIIWIMLLNALLLLLFKSCAQNATMKWRNFAKVISVIRLRRFLKLSLRIMKFLVCVLI